MIYNITLLTQNENDMIQLSKSELIDKCERISDLKNRTDICLFGESGNYDEPETLEYYFDASPITIKGVRYEINGNICFTRNYEYWENEPGDNGYKHEDSDHEFDINISNKEGEQIKFELI